jgi:hypothetical protein
MMLVYAIAFCAYDVAVRAYVSFWSFKVIHDRTPLARHNEYLRFTEMTAYATLVGAFFIFFTFGRGMAQALIVIAAVLCLDTLIRYACLHAEARRLYASSRGRSYRSAVRRVRKRATAPLFQ